MSELKSRPPVKPKQQDMEDFISGVEPKSKKGKVTLKSKPSKLTVYPWEAENVRDDVVKVYNLRLPEAYLLKLKYIADNTPDSMQKFCLHILQDAIDAKIAELTQ